jgi:hypothetical protein
MKLNLNWLRRKKKQPDVTPMLHEYRIIEVAHKTYNVARLEEDGTWTGVPWQWTTVYGEKKSEANFPGIGYAKLAIDEDNLALIKERQIAEYESQLPRLVKTVPRTPRVDDWR